MIINNFNHLNLDFWNFSITTNRKFTNLSHRTSARGRRRTAGSSRTTCSETSASDRRARFGQWMRSRSRNVGTGSGGGSRYVYKVKFSSLWPWRSFRRLDCLMIHGLVRLAQDLQDELNAEGSPLSHLKPSKQTTCLVFFTKFISL